MSLKDLIDNSGKTRYQIAQEAGMSHGALRRYYQGESAFSNMTILTAIRLAKALELPLTELIEKGLEGDEPEDTLYGRACRLGRR